MRCSIIFLFLSCVLLSVFTGCYPSQTSRLSNVKNVLLEEYEVPPVFLSSGTGIKSEATHDFLYENITNELVTLSLENTSCGCTRVKIVPESVQPGHTAVISVSYDLAYSLEKRSELVSIKTNIQKPERLLYRLSVKTFPRLEIEKIAPVELVCEPGKSLIIPIRCRSFSPVSDGSSGSMKLVSSSELAKLEILHSTPEPKSRVLEGIVKQENNYHLHLFCPEITLPEHNDDGYRTTLMLSDERYQTSIRMDWKPKQYIFTDKKVFFNCLLESKEEEAVTLQSEQPFSIRSVNTLNGFCEIRCPVNQSTTQHQIIVSRIDDIKLITKNEDIITLSTDHPRQPAIRIKVSFLLPCMITLFLGEDHSAESGDLFPLSSLPLKRQ